MMELLFAEIRKGHVEKLCQMKAGAAAQIDKKRKLERTKIARRLVSAE